MNESKPNGNQISAVPPSGRRPPLTRHRFTPIDIPKRGGDADTISNAWHAVLRGKWVVLGSIAAGILLAIGVSGLQTPLYQGKTILELRDPSHNISPFAPVSAAT